MARVVELTSYPVKGCAGVRTSGTVLTEAGTVHDRSFMVVDDRGVFRSQRRDPRLAVIRPEIEPRADADLLVLRAAGAPPLRLRIDTGASGARTGVEMFGTPYRAVDQGREAGLWLSRVLGVPSRLVRVPPDHGRVTDGSTPGTSGFADSSAVHVVSLAALAALNRRIGAAGRPPVPVARFRPNIVVDGWEEPDTEDRIRLMAVGGAELAYAKPAIRCAVTMVDQVDGTRAGPEPLRTLATYRRARGGGVAFGVKFAVVRTGRITVGDTVAVTAWGPSEV